MVVVDGGFVGVYSAGVTIGDQVDDQGQVVLKDTSDASKTAYGLVLVSLVLGNKARSTIM